MSLFRKCLERFSRGIAFKRTLNTPKGNRKIWVTPEARLRFWLPDSPNSDADLLSFAAHMLNEGSRVWDIGANVGQFTFASAAIVGKSGRVLAVEADPFLSALMQRTCAEVRPDDARPEILSAAVSGTHSIAMLAVPERSRASNHLVETGGSSEAGSVFQSYPVLTVTLDWLLEHTFVPDVVKIDIEGMEYSALSAAHDLLDRARPVLHLEVWQEIQSEITQFLRGKKYLIFDGEATDWTKAPVDRAAWVTIAVPEEKLEAVTSRFRRDSQSSFA